MSGRSLPLRKRHLTSIQQLDVPRDSRWSGVLAMLDVLPFIHITVGSTYLITAIALAATKAHTARVELAVSALR